MVLAKRARTQAVRIRYYLATANQLLRIPSRLHHDLISGKASLPEFASTEQRILEVVARQLTTSTYVVSARGLVYVFAPNGFLNFDLNAYFPDLRRPVREANVINLVQALSVRGARQKHLWRPSKSMIEKVKNDIVPINNESRCLPILRPRS